MGLLGWLSGRQSTAGCRPTDSGIPTFERLEPRILLSADTGYSSLVVESYQRPLDEQVIEVGLTPGTTPIQQASQDSSCDQVTDVTPPVVVEPEGNPSSPTENELADTGVGPCTLTAPGAASEVSLNPAPAGMVEDDPAVVLPDSQGEVNLGLEAGEAIQIRGPPQGESGVFNTDNAVLGTEAGKVLVVHAYEYGHALTLRIDASDPSSIQVTDVRGEVRASALLGDVTGVWVVGSADIDDTLTIDLSTPPPCDLAIRFDGGAGGYDILAVRGMAVGTYTPGQVFGDGEIQAGATSISFTGLEPVFIDGGTVDGTSPAGLNTTALPATLTFVTPGSADVIVIDSPAEGQNRISGTSDGVAFEEIAFTNIQALVIDTGANDVAGADADEIAIVADLVATGLTSVTITSGTGDDVLRVQVETLSVPVSFNGEEGEDQIEGPATEDPEGAITWNLTGPGTGNLGGTAGLVYTNVESLVGGGGNDTFVFAADGSFDGKIDGGLGEANRLDFSTFTVPVVVNLGMGIATRIDDGGNTLWMVSVSSIQDAQGGSGGDILIGDANANKLTGGGGSDTLVGEAGNDTLIGGAGDDTYLLTPGDTDTITEAAGEGNDTLSYSAYTTEYPVTVDLAAGTATGTAGVANIENVIGGSGDDWLTGDAYANQLTGGSGSDILAGGAGSDTLIGGPGDDTYVLAPGGDTDTITEVAGEGSDTLDYSAYVTGVAVTLGGLGPGVSGIVSNIENVIGGSGDDLLTGDANANRLDGGPGNDTLIGGAGDDTYVLNPDGTDTITETGGGNDTLDCSAFTDPVTVDLAAGTGPGASSTANIENVIGGSGADSLTGDGNANRLDGGPGNDILTGGAGDDTYVLDPAGNDTIVETGGGSDTLDYSAFTDPVTVNLATGVAPGASSTANIENVTGGAGNDSLMGDANANCLTGGPGDDTLAGGLGDDSYVITPEGGADTITEVSGEGNDTVYGPDVDTDWIITTGYDSDGDGTVDVTLGPNGGYITGMTTFVGIENLVGGSADDNFKFEADGSISGGIQGGGQVEGDAIIAAAEVNAWNVTGANAGELNGNSFSGIENLIGGSTNDTFSFSAGGSISGVISGGPDCAEDYVEGEEQGITLGVDTIDCSALAGPLTVDLEEGTVEEGATPLAGSYDAIDVFIGSAATGLAGDTVIGYDLPDLLWTITGPDEFTVAATSFQGFENLTGQANNSDGFLVEADGSISGLVDGGTGGTDGLFITTVLGIGMIVDIAATDSSGTTDPDDYGKAVTYENLDPQQFAFYTDLQNVIIAGSIFDDTIYVYAEDLDGDTEGVEEALTIERGSSTYTIDGAQVAQLTSLRIEGRAGTDTIYVESLPAGYGGVDGADLLIYGSRLPALDVAQVPEDDPFIDRVDFTGSINLNGGFLDVWADRITVADGTEEDPIVIETVDNDICFRARLLGIAELENLVPLGFGTDRWVDITIGKYAQLKGYGLWLFSQAEDKSLADTIGATKEIENFVIEPLMGKIADLIALPVKVLVKNCTATVTFREGCQLIATGPIGIYATAAADASGVAKGSLFSIGYAQANASADITVETGVLIQAEEAVVITSTGEAKAGMKVDTKHKIDNLPNPSGAPVAIALGVSYANAYSHVTVAQGATVEAGRTANVTAKGKIESEAEAESGLFSDGKAGLAFALEFSEADIDTTVDGTIIAKCDPVGGYTVKIEIDPTVSAADFNSLQTGVNLLNGDTVQLVFDEDGFAAGTVMKYLGTDATAADLTNQNYADPAIWIQTTPNIGYVDYANNRIYVGPNALVTEDTVTYTRRRGINIGNLVDGREYYVVTDGDGWIQLAESEINALRVAAGEGWWAVDLFGGMGTANNQKSFTAAHVNSADDTITLDRDDPVFNTFELGQAVIFQAGEGCSIEGLTPGNTYYVVASTTEQNIQGDTRLVSKQIIRLAELENEARAGVFIDLGTATGTDFTLVAKHVLDSGFATGVGVVANLEAETKVSAKAGLKSEDTDEPCKWEKFTEALETNLLDKIFQGLTKSYNDNAAKPEAGASGSLAVSGALAFSYADHDVTTNVGDHAVLKSNEDLEVKATIAHKYNLGAESSTEPQSGKDGKSAQSSAPNNVSVAIAVGIFDNNAVTTVNVPDDDGDDPGAQLDALRNLRITSDITYPLLQRLDTYIPLSWIELVDSIRTEGLKAITKYINGTLGFQEAFFNTWTVASASADKIGIAGSVSVLVFTNNCEALVKNGAQLNQDVTWRDDTLNPHPNQDNESGVPDADGAEFEQVVSVESLIAQQTITMTGNFSLPELPAPVPGDLNKTKKNFSKFLSTLNPKGDESVAGTSGERGGAGGSFFISVADDTSHAIVEDGTWVHSGADGGFNIKAREMLLNVNLAQSYAKGGTFVIGGTILYVEQISDTLAQLGSKAHVTGRDVRLLALDQSTVATWAGGIARGEAIGIGIAVAINNFNRTTRALIGDEDAAAGTPILNTNYINVTGAVQTQACLAGDLWAFTVAGSVVKDEKPQNPTKTKDPQDPMDGVPLPAPIGGGSDNKEGSKTGVGVAAAVSINLITGETTSRIADAGHLQAGFVSVQAENDAGLIAATGGLAVVLKDSGKTAVALAGAFSYNEITADTVAEVQDTDLVLTGNAAGDFVLDVNALTKSKIFTLAAGGAGSKASGGSGTQSGGSTAVSVAGSVSINVIDGDTSALLQDSTVLLDTGDARVRAEDRSSIFAIAGGLSISVATGQKGSSTAVSAGIAIAVNIISSSAKALIADLVNSSLSQAGLLWADEGSGNLIVEAVNDRDIGAFTLAGAVSVASGTQGNGVAAGGAASGSVNQLKGDTTATIHNSAVAVPGTVTVHAKDTSDIISAAGGIAVAVGVSSQGNGGAGSFGAAFAVNSIGTDSADDLVWADVDDSTVTAGGDITIIAESEATIFALAIGAAGSVTGSGNGNAIGISAAGSASVNTIRVNTQARARNSSELKTQAGTGAAIGLSADDDSSIQAVAGAAALSIAVSQNTAVAAGLGLSLTINDIANTTRAAVEDSGIIADGAVTVLADSDAEIDSLAFGIGVSVAISGNASAIAANCTGALSFNEIDNLVEATIRNTTGTATVSAGGALTVTASDDSVIKAIATAASASVSGSTTAVSVSVAIGFALAHNRIDKDVSASLVNLPGVLTNGGDVTVSATDASTIDAVTFAAAVAVAFNPGCSPSVGVAGGCSESTNVILSRTNAFIEDSVLGSEDEPVGKVDLDATSTAEINAVIGAVAAAVAVGNTGVGVAVGIAVARNFIGWDPNGVDVTADYESMFSPAPTFVDTLTPGMLVRTADGSVYEYIGAESNDSDPADGVQPFDLSLLDYTAATLWDQVVAATYEEGGEQVGTLVGALTPGMKVLVSSNIIPDNVYEYIGDELTDSDPDTAGNQQFDLSLQDYGDGTLWTQVEVTPAENEGLQIGTRVDELTPGMTVHISSGALMDDIYEYIGDKLTDSDPSTPELDPFDLSVQQYRDATLWKQASLGPNAAQVQAYIADSSVWAEDALTSDAKASGTIDATVVAVAVGVGAGSSAGVAVSVTGSYSENRIKTDVKAYIADTATHGIEALSVWLYAEDGSGINAVAGAASLSVGFGSTAGVAVAAGLSLAFNEVSNNVEAYIRGMDEGVTTSGGSITISAVSQGQHLFDLTVGDLLTPANLDDAATADPDNPDDPTNEPVKTLKTSDDPNTPDIDETEYEYTGGDDVTSRSDDTVNEAVEDADDDLAILGALRGAFEDDGETLATYDIVSTAAKYQSSDGEQDIREGDTVRLEKGYTAGEDAEYDGGKGLEGRVYRYIVKASETDDTENLVNLSTEDYTDIAKWQLVDKLKLAILVEGKKWMLVAPDGKAYVLELIDANTISVSRNTINAVSAAASMAIGVSGSAGIAVSGAGAVAQNVILTKTHAYGLDSVLDSGGDVTLDAASKSKISSVVVAASLAIGGGGAAGVGASIGVSVARNFIGWTPDGTKTPAEVQAYLKNTSVDAEGDLKLTSRAAQTINCVVIAGSVAVGLGGTAGVAVSGSGVWAENKIGVDVESYIEGDRDSGISAASITLTADDTSTITATACAVSVAASVGGAAGVSVSIGVSLARNTITGSVEAYILNADGLPGDTADFGVDAGTNGIMIAATESATIKAVSAAASLAAGFGGAAGIAVSGAGADANNIILTDTNAYIEGSSVYSDGKVDLDAANTGIIRAVVVSASAAISVGGFAGVGASIGVAVARNYIGWDPDYNYDETEYYETGDTDVAQIVTGDRVKIAAGPNAGNVYQYIGEASLEQPTATGTGDGEGNADENANWLTRLDYSDQSQWRLINLEKNAAEVQAFILNSNVDATGELTLDALSDQTIEATVFAGSVAISGGLVGVAVSGAGASSENRIATLVQAYLQGDKDGKGITAASISLNAEDTSDIDSFTGAVSVAASGGLVGVALSIGVGVAFNEIDNSVAAFIKDIDAGVTTDVGDISLEASENANIHATAFAASAGVGIGAVGGALSGAGAVAHNIILGGANAYVINSALDSAQDVILDAANTSTINAEVMAASAAVGVGAFVGAGLSIGVAVAKNSIGYTSDGDYSPIAVQAYIQDSSVDATRDLKLTATSTQDIDAIVWAGSVAASAGGFAGIGVSGAGASAVNRVAANVKAYIDGSGTTGVIADSIAITATDTSFINATVGTASVAIGFGLAGVAISVGVSLAHNEVNNRVSAYIANGQDVRTRSGGDITISATENATITAYGVAASAAAGAGALGIGFAGAGARVTNVILNKTNAYIENAVIESGGDVVITATDTSTIAATIGTGAGALGAGAVGGAVAIGVAIAQNLIGYTTSGTADPAEVQAYVKNASIDAVGELSLTADADQTISATVVAGSVAIAAGIVAIGGAGAGASTRNRIKTWIKAFIDGDAPTDGEVSGISAAGISLLADDDSTITATTGSAAVAVTIGFVSGSVAIGVGVAKNDIANEVEAYIVNAGDVKATGSGGITIWATDSATIKSTAVAASAALSVGWAGLSVSGAGVDAVNLIGTVTHAYVEDSVLDSEGKVEVKSDDTSTITAWVLTTATTASGGVYAGAIAIGAATARNLIGWGTDPSVEGSYTTADNPDSVANGQTVKVVNGADAGYVYKFIGGDSLAKPDEAPENWLEQVDYSDRTQWELVNLGRDAAEVYAYIQDSEVHAEGNVTVSATEDANITADIRATAVSVSGGMIAVAVSGAGISIENKVNTDVEAFVAGTDSEGAMLTLVEGGGTVSITATDASTITATANAVSFAAAIGLGGAGAISLSFANNTIENDVEAYATNAEIVTTSDTADLVITATETATITSTSTASAAAVSSIFSGAVGSATSDATVTTTTRAYADPVELDIAGNVDIAAILTADASAATAGAALSVALIAYADVRTEATATVNPLVESYLGGYADGRLVQAAGDISVGATMAAGAKALVDGSSIAAGLGYAHAAPKATAVIAPLTLDEKEEPVAAISSSIRGGTVVSTDGDIVVKAVYNEDLSVEGTVIALGTGAEATTHAASGSFVAKGSAEARAVETPCLDSWVAGDTMLDDGSTRSRATLSAGNIIRVISSSLTTPEAEASGKSGGFVGLGESDAYATGSPIVNAHMDGMIGSAASPGAGLEVRAIGIDKAKATAVVVAKGLGADGDNESQATVSPTLDAHIGGSSQVYVSGNVTVEAKDNPEADASTKGVAKGFVGLGGSVSRVDVTSYATASIDTGALINAGSVNVNAIVQPEIPTNQPDYNILSIDPDNNTITTKTAHYLQTGDVIEYHTDGTEIGGLDQTYTNDDGETVSRQYSVIYVYEDTIALGAGLTTPEGKPVSGTVLQEGSTVTVTGFQVEGDSTSYAAGETADLEGVGTFTMNAAGAYTWTPASGYSGSVPIITYTLSTGGEPLMLVVEAEATYAGVNPLNETITFATAHNFRDGDIVIYTPADSTKVIPGLTPGAQYTVRVIDANSIQLVAPGAYRNDFTVSDIQADGKTIKESNTFTDGQAVTYVAPPAITFASSQVDVDVDFGDDTIDPAPDANNIVFMDAEEREDDTTDIYGVDHGFAEGDYVVYRVSSAGAGGDGTAIGGLTSDWIYRVVEKTPHSLKLAPTVSGTITFVTKAVSGGQAYMSMSGLDWADYGFAAGQGIQVKDGTNTDNNGSYTIASVEGNKLFITGDFAKAKTIAGKTVDGKTAIELTPDSEDGSVHSLVLAGNAQIGGLVNGQTYYVVHRASDGSSYQLAHTPGGTAIRLNKTGLNSNATHWVGPQSIDLGTPAPMTTHEFRIDITGTLPSGTHMLTGEDGVNLAEIVSPPGDAVSTAYSQGSGKGFVGEANNSSESKANATVTAYIATGSLTTTGDVLVLAHSETNHRANTTNSSGGFVGIGKSDAKTDQESTTHAYIAEGANIISGGNVMVDAWSNHITTGSATAKAGGFAADVRANMTSELSYDTQAYLKTAAKIAAAGHVGITSDANANVNTHSNADGRGFGGGGYAETEIDILSGSQGLAKLDPGAVVIADTAALRATTSSMYVHGDARGYGAGFVGVSKDWADIDIYALNQVLLDGGSSLTGYRGVDLEASFNNVDTYTYCYAKVAGLFGALDSRADNNTTLTSNVVTDLGAQVTAGPRDNASSSYDYTYRSLFWPTDLDTGDRVRMPGRAIYIYLGDPVRTSSLWLAMQLLTYRTSPLWERDVLAQEEDVLDHPTGDAGPLDQLALYVNTTNSNVSITADADKKKKALASGGAHTDIDSRQTRTIDWKADVHILSGAGEGAELVISDTGEIVKADGITVKTAADAEQDSGQIADTETEIFVNDIADSGGAGQVYFNDAYVGDLIDDDDDEEEDNDADRVAISGIGSTWDFSDTLGQVLITNHWDRDLKINNINVVNTTDKPLVDLNSRYVWLMFNIEHAASPSLVQILNEADSDSDIILNGTINNPIGSTVIHNSGGDIVAARARGVPESETDRISLIRTAVLDIRATGSIGLGPVLDSDSPRVNVDMIYPELPGMDFRGNVACGGADALFLDPNPFFTGQLVKYETVGTPIDGLVSGKYYTVIRSDDGTIQLATPGGDAIPLTPLDNTTVFTLTAAQHVVGDAGGDIYLDLKAVLRDETPVTEFTATIDSLTAGGSIDVLLQDAEQETGTNGTYGAVRVTALQAAPPPPLYLDWDYYTRFWNDVPTPQARDLAVYGGTTIAPRNCIYDFRDINPATGDRTTVAGLIAGTGNIIIKDVEGATTGEGLATPTVAVLGLTDLLGTGHIDVNVDNWVDLTEITGALRVGLIYSRGADVTLLASAGSILDALNDAASDVTGVNITLTALPGGIGTFMNRLEFSWSNPTAGLSHLLRATVDKVTWYTFTYAGQTGAILDAGTIHLRYVPPAP